MTQPPNALGTYPSTRIRRNRRAPWSRALVAENRLSPADFIYPIFVGEGRKTATSIASMPGIERVTVDLLPAVAEEVASLGIPAIAIFPEVDPAAKTPDAAEAHNPNNLVCRAIKAIKGTTGEIGVVCDAALDPFNSDGHDGILRDGIILNDETVEILCRQSVVQAAAGCDVIAPSDMMDGRVGAIRSALDAAGFEHVAILSYAAKYASAFYGPFRDAIGTKAALKGDKKTYQMDPANGDEAVREVAMDLAEGADMVMVKPGLAYLDILHRVKDAFGVPTFAYQVSGEYAMIKAAARNGWLDNDLAILETLMAFKRAGADGVLTYFAIEAARLLKRG